jgi:hypothetical protein
MASGRDATPIRQDGGPVIVDSSMDADAPLPPPAGGSAAAAADALIRSGAFVECVFHCPACGRAGTSLIRPAAVAGKACASCGEPVVVSVLERFVRRAG